MTGSRRWKRHWLVGHVCAVMAASFAFVGEATFAHFFHGGLSSVHPMSTLTFHLAVTSFLLFIAGAFVGFFAAMVPVIVVHRVARRLSISNVWYYVAAGALTGLLLSPVVAAIIPRPEPAFHEAAANIALFLAPSGAVGGLVFWWVVGRFIRTPACSDASS